MPPVTNDGHDEGSEAFDESILAHCYAQVGDVRLHYVEAGRGPLVVLLHGFPEFWYAWRHQIAPLVRAGFRVVALDMRGYNLSDKPPGVAAYRVPLLVDDLAGLIRACGVARASVVGHDWGAGVAWAFAMQRPELLERIAVLNGPHPERLLRALTSMRQLAKSWYMLFFQLPRLPEMIARRDNFALLTRALRDEPVRRGAFDDRDLARYVAALSQPGALTAMINYYRAMFRPGASPRMRPVEAPALIIWGEEDPHLDRDLAVPSARLVPNARVEYVPDASHWVQHDRPRRVNELLIAFLREGVTRVPAEREASPR